MARDERHLAVRARMVAAQRERIRRAAAKRGLVLVGRRGRYWLHRPRGDGLGSLVAGGRVGLTLDELDDAIGVGQ